MTIYPVLIPFGLLINVKNKQKTVKSNKFLYHKVLILNIFSLGKGSVNLL